MCVRILVLGRWAFCLGGGGGGGIVVGDVVCALLLHHLSKVSDAPNGSPRTQRSCHSQCFVHVPLSRYLMGSTDGKGARV